MTCELCGTGSRRMFKVRDAKSDVHTICKACLNMCHNKYESIKK